MVSEGAIRLVRCVCGRGEMRSARRDGVPGVGTCGVLAQATSNRVASRWCRQSARAPLPVAKWDTVRACVARSFVLFGLLSVGCRLRRVVDDAGGRRLPPAGMPGVGGRLVVQVVAARLEGGESVGFGAEGRDVSCGVGGFQPLAGAEVFRVEFVAVAGVGHHQA